MLQRQLGNIVVNRIVESEGADPFFDPLAFFPETTPEDWERHRAWMQPRAVDPVSGKLVLAIQSFLVRTHHRTVLPSPSLGHIVPRGNAFWFAFEHTATRTP